MIAPVTVSARPGIDVDLLVRADRVFSPDHDLDGPGIVAIEGRRP